MAPLEKGNYCFRPIASPESKKLQKVLRSGVLFKQGKGGWFHRSNWKTRYFELTPRSLKYFDKQNGELKGELSFDTFEQLEIMPRDRQFDGKHATLWRFAIRTKQRRMIFAALNEKDMNECILELYKALNLKTHRPGRYTDLAVENNARLARRLEQLTSQQSL